jgi:hypothetical protein
MAASYLHFATMEHAKAESYSIAYGAAVLSNNSNGVVLNRTGYTSSDVSLHPAAAIAI